MPLVCGWDPRKNRSNHKKDGIKFGEAASVFGNPRARVFPDEDHSGEETREIIIGHSTAKRLLLACCTERG